MERYQVILAYDGANFAGFQRQGKRRTVQGVVEAALGRLGWQGRTILAAGRTDAGVHASGQVITFDLVWQHSPEVLLRALNALLPADAAAQAISIVRADFHPCYDAVERTYRYQVYLRPVREPLLDRIAWRLWPTPATDLLEQAAAFLAGTHNFAAYGTPPRVNGTTVRTITRAAWSFWAGEMVFEVSANAFLYHMVRRLVYAQVLVAQGRAPLSLISHSLESGDPSLIKGLAPPQGLSLVRVTYLPQAEKRESNPE